MAMTKFVVGAVAASLPAALADCTDYRCGAHPGCRLVTYPPTGPHIADLEFECTGAEEGKAVFGATGHYSPCNYDIQNEVSPSEVCGNVRAQHWPAVQVDCYQAGSCTLSRSYMTDEKECECEHYCLPGRISDGSECSPCEAGTYKPGYIDNQCLPCPEGTTSTAGSAMCETGPDCLPGRTSDGSECSPCEAGTYKPGYNDNQCLPCPEGTTSTAGSAQCGTCPESGYATIADVSQGDNGVAKAGVYQGSGRWKSEEGCSRYCQRRFPESVGFQTHGTRDGERGFCTCIESFVLTKEPEAYRVPPRVMQYCGADRRLEADAVSV